MLCVENTNYPAPLERHKIYHVIGDRQASKHGQVRVIDESGEDYLYPQEYFIPIKLPQAAERAVLGRSVAIFWEGHGFSRNESPTSALLAAVMAVFGMNSEVGKRCTNRNP